ncbi:phosphotransferase [Nonomuraea phyllanthi]|uniref:aminoglycoside phosphotransferase family protein n=1 Tax=Nonomuraea phyllanthi TaxID=2219224 RepID=UPI0012935355|nr:aminoglycoside phosphotransferase family protein [Nonomuraea phyllanthi]QFY11700.1 phosphotransferase [Nonomuraea phyllanthi]
MSVSQVATHDVEIHDEIVIKRYRSWDRLEPHREWTALHLLAEHAPGLAPTPLGADLDGTPPTLVMSRLPGTPLRGQVAGPEQVRALAAALTRLHRTVPAAESLKPAAWHPAAAVAHVRARVAEDPDLGDSPTVRQARALGTAWLSGPSIDRLPADPFPPVLGLADGNRANYLWDAAGARVHLVDWEDSGRADRAFELADLCEHISHADGHLDTDLLLAQLDLSAGEAARVREFRRLIALGWLLMLGPGGPATHRNPPGTLDHQARRVLTLLDG